MKLQKQVLTHDWSSEDRHVLLERMELLDRLCKLPMNEVEPILKLLPVDQAANVFKLLVVFLREGAR